MIIIQPSATLEWVTPEAEYIIERAGRTCYKSEDKIGPGTASHLICNLIQKGHESVLEHASASFRLVTDRGVSHELVRHRIASFSQESTRYCDYGKDGDISVIEPPELSQCLDPSVHGCIREDLTCCPWHEWSGATSHACDAYLRMRDKGVSPQIARSVLPTCLKTELVMTANFREWRLIFGLRLSPRAHPQMRQLMKLVASKLVELHPCIFQDVIPI